jgi:hypothetical protein
MLDGSSLATGPSRHMVGQRSVPSEPVLRPRRGAASGFTWNRVGARSQVGACVAVGWPKTGKDCGRPGGGSAIACGPGGGAGPGWDGGPDRPAGRRSWHRRPGSPVTYRPGTQRPHPHRPRRPRAGRRGTRKGRRRSSRKAGRTAGRRTGLELGAEAGRRRSAAGWADGRRPSGAGLAGAVVSAGLDATVN